MQRHSRTQNASRKFLEGVRNKEARDTKSSRCLRLKCSETRLQASLFQTFPWCDTTGLPLKGDRQKGEGEGSGTERGRLPRGCWGTVNG